MAKAKERPKEGPAAKQKGTSSNHKRSGHRNNSSRDSCGCRALHLGNYKLASKEIAFAAGTGDIELQSVAESGLAKKKLRTLIRKFRMKLGSGVQKNGSNFPSMTKTKKMILMVVVVWINRVSQLNRSPNSLCFLSICRLTTWRIQFGFLDCRRHLVSNGRKKIL